MAASIANNSACAMTEQSILKNFLFLGSDVCTRYLFCIALSNIAWQFIFRRKRQDTKKPSDEFGNVASE